MAFMEVVIWLTRFHTKSPLKPSIPLVLFCTLILPNTAFAAVQPQCTVTIVNQWWSGSQVSVQVKNPGSQALQDWHVELTYSDGGSVVNSWSATQTGSNPALFSAPPWKASLAPNEQYELGYIAVHNAGPQTPAITGCYQGSPMAADADSDGVADDLDLCPNTPNAEAVDTQGCGWSQLDEDGDSVLNPDDNCPNTPINESANNSGCSTSQLDSDNDGVNNTLDACPNTTAGQSVNSAGCALYQLDSDGDGISDAIDSCPNTASGSAVNTSGCAVNQLDTDGDGVHDGIDACANTPTNEIPDTNGCSASQLDSDNDGISDALDACPATTASIVDANGCAPYQLDSDNDGVHDGIDNCANTPVNEVSDANGCSISQRDSDSDGINDSVDICPNTGAGNGVNSEGCAAEQLDSDDDGINDAEDLCPNTTAGSVNTAGCTLEQLDSDNDGVNDAIDTCPNTSGTNVDAQGCSPYQADADNDGIPDFIDSCSNTPANETVNQSGCSPSQLDLDNDTVSDDLDACPNTLAGQPVNADGCALYQLDTDSDGINDKLDLCPNTPINEVADPNGCSPTQRDTDNDGVNDATDTCPSTMINQSVDAVGCALYQLDSDNDGAHNGIDECPNTPTNETTDLRGCAPSQLDSDNDGANDAIDACPNTTAGSAVDAVGCALYQLDSDNDGIQDDLDLCPSTPATDTADAAGCGATQLDDDGDGVVNANDTCPNTPSSEVVSTEGCSWNQLDDDDDGIANGNDQCLSTPIGETVDNNGCWWNELDDDGDGIENGQDNCANTPAGESVFGDGCAIGQLDDDGDGVINYDDLCPNTGWGVAIDTAGCSEQQRDDDNDGTTNYYDMCPSTPADEVADELGCSSSQRDQDYDGVMDDKDLCPDSQTSSVNSYGCGYWDDEDGDKIPNDRDACPFIKGLMILHGCGSTYGDFDSDGVPDDMDQCPLTLHPEAMRPPEFMPVELDEIDPATGCSLSDLQDFDGDGVPWGSDECWHIIPLNPGNGSYYSVDDKGCDYTEVDDEDGDGVMRSHDECPYDFGSPLLNGCPDAPSSDIDNDGVQNEQDQCPFSPETFPVSANGCLLNTNEVNMEDRDHDGVNNSFDLCPSTLVGHKVNSDGCTPTQLAARGDGDMDGVPNGWDYCDNSFGEGTFNPKVSAYGCPYDDLTMDQDHDGIPASRDACPDQNGLDLHGGCPTVLTQFNPHETIFQVPYIPVDDIDADGINNPSDSCPFSRQALVPDNQGFMRADSKGCLRTDYLDDDMDGVINGRDRCPRSRNIHYLDSEGCNDEDRLDLDGDGLINGMDLCPSVPGYTKLNGCAFSPTDSDLDGVENMNDRCPTSIVEFGAPWATIDPATGCATISGPMDSDNDGIANDFDQCPNTPKDEPAQSFNQGTSDELGCSYSDLLSRKDQDNDGIANEYDLCPDSISEQIVNSDGCADPFGDIDGDNIPNDQDQCNDSVWGKPVEPNGCSMEDETGLHLQSAIKFGHVSINAPPGPESEIIVKLKENGLLTQFGDMVNSPVAFEFGTLLPWAQIIYINVMESAQEITVMVPPELRSQEIHIPFRVQLLDSGETSNWSEIIIGSKSSSGSNVPQASLLINDPNVLNMTGITLRQVFGNLADYFDPDAVPLFKQFWASQKSMPVEGSPFICSGAMSDFPIICDRPETDVATLSDFEAEQEMNLYQLTAVVNRMDLRKPNWADCGEQRLIFAIPNDPRGRNFLNFEARVPNPIQGSAEGCRPLIEFWQELPNLNPMDQSMRIRQLFVDFSPESSLPIMTRQNFESMSGQIRSNQFMGGEWLLKEHKLNSGCDFRRCGVMVETVSVKENPFGPLFDPNLPMSGGPLAITAADFQSDFVFLALEGLSSANLAELKLQTPEQYNSNQSFAAGPETMDNNYLMHFTSGGPSPFADQIFSMIFDKTNADGSPLLPEQVVARASTQTCGGCHNPESIGISEPGVIGTLALPNGDIIDRWPRSLDFVHIDEFGNLSPALQDVFIPLRQADFANVIEQL